MRAIALRIVLESNTKSCFDQGSLALVNTVACDMADQQLAATRDRCAEHMLSNDQLSMHAHLSVKCTSKCPPLCIKRAGCRPVC